MTAHPQLAPLEQLLGSWRGRGRGRYPTIASFEYEEEVRFWHTGRPWLGYEQRTRHPETGAPMHSEAGYWRPLAEGRIEIVLSHAFGICEVQEGRIAGNRIEVESTSLVSTASAKEVDAVTRVFVLDGDLLTYQLGMALGGQPMQNHLAAELKRI